MKKPPPPRPPLQGVKYLKRVAPLLERLRDDGCERDTAGNRQFHFDRYAAVLLLYFFNASITSLRGIQQATELRQVARLTGGGRVSLGSLSEAANVFDPARLREVLRELATDALPHELPKEQKALADLVAVDGTLLRALPGMAWAMWRDPSHRAAKVHLAFEVFRGGPADATLTAGSASEREQFKSHLLQAGRVYVLDRGYESYELLAAIRQANSSFVARLQADAAFEVAMQVYAALIASVLLGQWTGRRPDKRTWEMFCHFFSGWASEEELEQYLRRAEAAARAKAEAKAKAKGPSG